MKIAFATGNDLKFATAVEHLAALPVELEQVRLDLDEIQSADIGAVARHKARQAHRLLGRPVIVEDSGFGLDELGGYPGPMVKFTVAALGASGIARLADLTATRACRYTSCLVYVDERGSQHAFRSEEPCTVARAGRPGPVRRLVAAVERRDPGRLLPAPGRAARRRARPRPRRVAGALDVPAVR